jgi:hypothetical protein
MKPREDVVKRCIGHDIIVKDKTRGTWRGKVRENERNRTCRLALTFQEWLDLLVNARLVFIEGVAPRRIIWSTLSNVYDCVDIMSPIARLTIEEAKSLVSHLVKDQPQVLHGRYGFADYLASNAPGRIRMMPRGELIMSFMTLGRVS